MVTQRKIEWKDADVWRSVKVELSCTRNMNMSFKHNGLVYVFENLKAGNKVVVLQGLKWVKAGRIDKYGTIFLGEGESYGEMVDRVNASKSPEQLRADLRSFLDAEVPGMFARTEKTLECLKNVKGVNLW